MIVIGTDTHKTSHTVAALEETTGRVLADHTVRARRRSFEDLLRWARRLAGERVWALEDCRHVSGALERFLLARGERVVRVAPKLTAGARDSAREPGKSDAIDAVAIARAAIREGLDALPLAQLAGIELDIRLLVDHRERLVGSRTRLTNDLRWHLHDLRPELEIPTGGLIAVHFPERLARRSRPPEHQDPDRTRRAATHPRAHPHDQPARTRPRTTRRPGRAAAARGARLRGTRRRQARRRDRRHQPLRQRREARPHRWISPNTRQFRQDDPLPPRPWRQPPDQLRAPPPRPHQEPPRPQHRRLPRPQASRWQDQTRSDALPQTTPRTPCLAPPPNRHQAPANSPDDPLRHPLQQLLLDIGATRQAAASRVDQVGQGLGRGEAVLPERAGRHGVLVREAVARRLHEFVQRRRQSEERR